MLPRGTYQSDSIRWQVVSVALVLTMPFTNIRASLTVPTEHAEEVHESMDQAIDQLIVNNIPVSDSEITEACADPPVEPE